MAVQGFFPPCMMAGVLYTPELEHDYGDQWRWEKAWALVLLLTDGTVQTEPLPGVPRTAGGRWEILHNPIIPTQDPRLQIRLALSDVTLGGSDEGQHFDLQPVLDFQSSLGQFIWPGTGIDGVGIMMDYVKGAVWFPVQLLAAGP